MMAVDTKHPEYLQYESEWRKGRDCAEGQYSIHKAGEKYLPKLSDQTADEYKAYKERALFYEATSRTIQGLKGMVFRKPPVIEFEQMEEFLEDVDLQGNSILSIAQSLTEDVFEVGRVGVLIDYPNVNSENMTQAQAQALNARPYFHCYKAESITNWKVGRVANKAALVEVRLFEKAEIETDEFEIEEVKQYRVLDLIDGRYRQRLYRQNTKHQWEQFGDDIIPVMNGAPIPYIPFVFFSQNGTQSDVQKPPLAGLVNINISHYKTTADLEHGSHFTGLPTAFIKGVSTEDTENQTFKIGSTTAWAFSNESADAKYLEFTGQGLGALETRIQVKESMMASLGAQMLAPNQRRNEAAETAGMRHMGENSILSSISQSISEGLNKCLEIAGEWMNVTPATIELNRDFLPTPMTPQMLTALVASWQQGAISSQTLFENLKQGEVIANEKEFEEEQDEIDTSPVVLDAP